MTDPPSTDLAFVVLLAQLHSERVYLLARCLRLEGEMAALQKRTDALLRGSQPKRSSTTRAEIAQMRELRRLGHSFNVIGQRMGRSNTTVWHYAKDVSVAGVR